MQSIIERINALIASDAMHVRRGYRITQISVPAISNHMLEEAVEFQGAVLNGGREEQLEEAADMLLIWWHLCHRCSLTFDEIEKQALRKLDDYWTTTVADVTAKEPGYTRSTRGPRPETLEKPHF